MTYLHRAHNNLAIFGQLDGGCTIYWLTIFISFPYQIRGEYKTLCCICIVFASGLRERMALVVSFLVHVAAFAPICYVLAYNITFLFTKSHDHLAPIYFPSLPRQKKSRKQFHTKKIQHTFFPLKTRETRNPLWFWYVRQKYCFCATIDSAASSYIYHFNNTADKATFCAHLVLDRST